MEAKTMQTPFSGKGVPLSPTNAPKNNIGGTSSFSSPADKQQIVIVLSDLQFPAKYLHCHRTGQYDLLGQILYSLGYAIPPKTRIPSQLGLPIPYFTVALRDCIIDTPLTQELLRASQVIHPREILAHANGLLAKTPFVLVKG